MYGGAISSTQYMKLSIIKSGGGRGGEGDGHLPNAEYGLSTAKHNNWQVFFILSLIPRLCPLKWPGYEAITCTPCPTFSATCIVVIPTSTEHSYQ